jgi:hypothetical protein
MGDISENYPSTHLEGLTLYHLAERYKVHTKGVSVIHQASIKNEGEYSVEGVSLT